MSISVNGKPLLEIHSAADLMEVQNLLDLLKLKRDIQASNDLAMRNADAATRAVDDYEQTLGKSFRDLQHKLMAENIEHRFVDDGLDYDASFEDPVFPLTARESNSVSSGDEDVNIGAVDTCAYSIADDNYSVGGMNELKDEVVGFFKPTKVEHGVEKADLTKMAYNLSLVVDGVIVHVSV